MALSAIPTRVSSAPRATTAHAPDRRHEALPYWLSGGAAVLLVVASASGLFVPGLYRDAPNWIAQARGTDLVTLTVAVPALVASLILAAGGSPRVQAVWLGVLGYVLCMYVIYAFDVVFNPLFLVYVAVLSLSLFSLEALLVQMDPDGLGARFAPSLPVRTIAIYLLAVAAMFCIAWLKDIVPAMIGNTTPASLHGLHLPTNPVHVQDLSALLPLAALSGIWLWKRRPWGYVLAGVLLTALTIIGASVVSGILFEYVDDRTVSLGTVPLFAVVTLAGLGLLIVYIRNLRQKPQGGLR